MPTIPLTLHQTWKSHAVPARYRGFVSSFAVHNPQFEYRLWSDSDARAFVAEEFPELLATYDAYPYAILRADLFRYLVLFRRGGVYADLDIAFLAPIAPLLQRGGLVLASEPVEHAQGFGHRSLVCNAFMASKPGHPFWHSVIEEVVRQGPVCVTHLNVLELTGPLMLQRVLDRHREAGDLDSGGRLSDIEILRPEVVNPLPGAQLVEVRERGQVEDPLAADLTSRGAVALHVWSNGWVSTLAGDLNNPQPDRVSGFVFFDGMDSYGGDISNLGRCIADVARTCLQMPDAVAFNTDGFIKRSLRARGDWHRMAKPGEGQGLYVKRKHARIWWRLPIPPVLR